MGFLEEVGLLSEAMHLLEEALHPTEVPLRRVIAVGAVVPEKSSSLNATLPLQSNPTSPTKSSTP